MGGGSQLGSSSSVDFEIGGWGMMEYYKFGEIFSRVFAYRHMGQIKLEPTIKFLTVLISSKR